MKISKQFEDLAIGDKFEYLGSVYTKIKLEFDTMNHVDENGHLECWGRLGDQDILHIIPDTPEVIDLI